MQHSVLKICIGEYLKMWFSSFFNDQHTEYLKMWFSSFFNDQHTEYLKMWLSSFFNDQHTEYLKMWLSSFFNDQHSRIPENVFLLIFQLSAYRIPENVIILIFQWSAERTSYVSDNTLFRGASLPCVAWEHGQCSPSHLKLDPTTPLRFRCLQSPSLHLQARLCPLTPLPRDADRLSDRVITWYLQQQESPGLYIGDSPVNPRSLQYSQCKKELE